MLSMVGIFGCANVLVYLGYGEICRYCFGYAKFVGFFFFFFFLREAGIEVRAARVPVVGKSQSTPLDMKITPCILCCVAMKRQTFSMEINCTILNGTLVKNVDISARFRGRKRRFYIVAN